MTRLFQSNWIRLLAVLTLTALMRLPDLSASGHTYDLRLLAAWGESIYQQGLFGIYYNMPSANYPPVYVVMLGIVTPLWHNTPYLIPLLKFFPILCETILILAVAVWLSNDKKWGWIVPLLLAINPALIATTALWGQAESVMVLFLLLALLALNRDKPLLVGVFYALAMLTKFQSVVLVPLFVILMFRRYNWRMWLGSGVIFSVLMVVVMLPFINGSGWDAAMRHYITAWDPQPTTLNAFNVWYWITPPPAGDLWTIPTGWVMESDPFWNSFTYRNLGLGMVALYTLIICASMWFQYKEKREFLWATALYLGFFMLATKMHERYLFPAVIFSIVAIAQDRRVWFAAIGITLVYLYNILYTLDVHFVWLGLPLLRLLSGALLNAMILLGVALLLELARTLFPDTRIKLLNVAARGFALLIVGWMLILTLNPPHNALPADSVAVDVQLGSGITIEGYSQSADAFTLYWRINDEVPQGDYGVQLMTQQFGTLRLALDEALQIGNLPLHLSWAGRQLTSIYSLTVTDEPIYVSVYSEDRGWTSDVLPIRR